MGVPYTLPVLLSQVKTSFGPSSTLYGLRPGVGANTNTVAAGGWLTGAPSLLSYRGAANLNVSAANCATISADDIQYGSGSSSSSIEIIIRSNGQMFITRTGNNGGSASFAQVGDNPNRWIYRGGIDADVDVTEHVDVRFTKRGGTETSWGLSNDTWFACSTTRTISVFASRSGGGGGDSATLRGWLAFRKSGDASNTLIGNTFVDLAAGAYSDPGVPP